MPKKAPSLSIVEKPEKGSDQETKALVDEIIDLLVDHDRVQVSRVLATVGTFFSSQISIKPSTIAGSLP